MSGYKFRGKVNMQSALNKSKGGFDQDPNRFTWKLNDKGTFTAIMRFLPAPDNDIGFVKTMWHKFKDRNGRDINLACPKMAGQPCPICSYVNALFEKGDEQSKKIGSSMNSQKNYFANALIKRNESNPETVGKVMIVRYTKEINTIITSALEGDKDAGVAPINVFDYMGGADFVFKAIQKGEWPTYVNSKFEGVSPMTEEDAIRCDKSLHDLTPLLDESRSKIKPLKDILDIVRKAIGKDLSDYVDSRNVVEESSDASDGSELAEGGSSETENASTHTEAPAKETAPSSAPETASEAPASTPASSKKAEAPKSEKKPSANQKKDSGFWGDFDKD